MQPTLLVVLSHEQPPDSSLPSIRLSVPLDLHAKDDEVLAAVQRCRDQAARLSPAVASPPPTPSEEPGSTVQSAAPRLATSKQVGAINAMARRQGVELARTLHERFGVSSVSALTIREASTLIDELKSNLQTA